MGTTRPSLRSSVSDHFQRKGIGTALLEKLIQVGRDEKIDRITGDILPENNDMQRLCEKLGFRLIHTAGDPVMKAVDRALEARAGGDRPQALIVSE